MFDKVTARIVKLCYGLDMNYVDPQEIAQKVCEGYNHFRLLLVSIRVSLRLSWTTWLLRLLPT